MKCVLFQFLKMKKRESSTKNTAFSSSISLETTIPPKPNVQVPQKARHLSNTIVASSDSVKSGPKSDSPKDLGLLLQKTNESNHSNDNETAGWKKIEFSLDHQMPICKDYLETGYCTFGAACKFLHTRDDVTASAEYERKIAFRALEKSRNEKKKLDDEKEKLEEMKTCRICHHFFTEPVVTKCGHKFCSKCALERYRTTPNCAICGKNTNGIFNTVKNDEK